MTLRRCSFALLFGVCLAGCGGEDDEDTGADPTGDPTTNVGTDSTNPTTGPGTTDPATTDPATTDPGTTTGDESTGAESTGGPADSSSSDETAATAPEAPSNLEVTDQGGAGHLTWYDNSDDEDEFVIMRSTDGGDFLEVARTSFDIATYHDIAGSGSHTWYVYAINAVGMSDPTNEASLVIP